MAYHFAKTCEFLASDSLLLRPSHFKHVFPVHNHIFAVNYARILDSQLDFFAQESKATGFLFHKMISHTFKHIIHKYKRTKSLTQIQRVWAVTDFHTSEGKHLSYVDYPMTDDLVALRKEIGRLTSAKIDTYNEEQDKALEGLNIGALCDLSLYSSIEFKQDFEVVHEMWLDLLRFVQEQMEQREVKKIAAKPNSRSLNRLK
jgi:hypothetical protein